MGTHGVRQCDIPKMKSLISQGFSAEEIAAGMLGQIVPVKTVETFFKARTTEEKKGDKAAAKKRTDDPRHPQDRAAAERKRIKANGGS